MLVSKLKVNVKNLVSFAEVDKYVSFAASVKKDLIDPTFLRCLATFAKYEGKGKKLNIISGTRTIARQRELYFEYGGKFDAKKGYYYPDSVPKNKRLAAVPGTSWHNFGLAIDTDSEWAKEIEHEASSAMQNILKQYGIGKPMTLGNGTKLRESWHFVPLQCMVRVANRASLCPTGLPTT